MSRWGTKHILMAILVLAVCRFVPASGGASDLLSDTWVATDALGRQLPGKSVCGPPRQNRTVGIFYFLWLGQHGTSGPYDITQLLAANPTSPAWGPENAFHHWGQSELGYYLSDDEWVIRRHCHLLVDAGVDVLCFDVTNAFTYTSNYMLLCSVLSQIRAEGGRTPQICFLTNSYSAAVVQTLYNDLYSKNLYPDLWFRWQGKPLIMSKPDGLSEPILSFFNFRQSWAWSQGWFANGYHKWPWLDNYPQDYGWDTPGVPEEVPVSVAQHPTTNIGRSYHNHAQPDPAHLQTEQGLCLAEQSERALQLDPQFLFITGWNEWVAQRSLSDGSQWFLGRQLPAGESYFIDEYSQEYSRDIEPMKAGHTDDYYYQMMSLIRRFKGVRELEQASAPKTILIDAAFADWDSVQPEYWDTIYDTTVRNHAGWGSAGTYTNSTGRNDFVRLKVTYDADNVYFYAETRGTISSRTGANWMLLYIDADHNHDTGWEGYDYLVNSTVNSSSSTTLKVNTGGYNWSLVTNVSYRVSGNKMEIKLPRANLGIAGTTDLMFDFKWADNIQTPGDIISYCISGDTAPNRRASYRFNTLAGAPGLVTQFVTQASAGHITLAWQNPSTADYALTRIRYSTTGYPADPTQGTAVADVNGTPGSTGTFVHESLAAGPTYYYTAFAYDFDGNYAAGATVSRRLVPADFDGDEHVDQSDFGALQNCLSGEAIDHAPGCDWADLNHDSDVDVWDVAQFRQCFGGPLAPPGC
jgi:hypothetical protein